MIGFGYDSHRLAPGERMILGGVEIDAELGFVAHSDGDALIHALCDAILGAAGLGDIGEMFPDTDEKYQNADSSVFLREIVSIIKSKSLKIINIDATIALQKPKLKLYKSKIKENLAKLCEIHAERVNIKAKTGEKIGFVGRSEGAAVYCVCQLEPEQ